MRSLTNSERKLLTVLTVVLFAGASLIGLNLLLKQKNRLKMEISQLQGQQLESRIWLDDKELWLARKEWLEKTQPKLKGVEQAQSGLLQEVQKSAGKHKVKIEEQGFGNRETHPMYQEVSVTLKVTGKLENITKWLVDLQQPQYFQAITRFSLKSDKEPPNVICDLQVSRWYAPAS